MTETDWIWFMKDELPEFDDPTSDLEMFQREHINVLQQL